jgi:hypothetical protein
MRRRIDARITISAHQGQSPRLHQKATCRGRPTLQTPFQLAESQTADSWELEAEAGSWKLAAGSCLSLQEPTRPPF